MPDQRYSVMVLPVRHGKLLLQSFVKDGQQAWDGFGRFYQAGETPKETAVRVFADNFMQAIDPARLVQRAQLQYFIDKSEGLVDLKITIYFAEVTSGSIEAENTEWFELSNIPYKQMHQATGKWLPILLGKPELLKATIRVNQPGDHTSGEVSEFTIN